LIGQRDELSIARKKISALELELEDAKRHWQAHRKALLQVRSALGISADVDVINAAEAVRAELTRLHISRSS
jgi:hypothetical protein